MKTRYRFMLNDTECVVTSLAAGFARLFWPILHVYFTFRREKGKVRMEEGGGRRRGRREERNEEEGRKEQGWEAGERKEDGGREERGGRQEEGGDRKEEGREPARPPAQ